jgi:hypothetical protein
VSEADDSAASVQIAGSVRSSRTSTVASAAPPPLPPRKASVRVAVHPPARAPAPPSTNSDDFGDSTDGDSDEGAFERPSTDILRQMCGLPSGTLQPAARPPEPPAPPSSGPASLTPESPYENHLPQPPSHSSASDYVNDPPPVPEIRAMSHDATDEDSDAVVTGGIARDDTYATPAVIAPPPSNDAAGTQGGGIKRAACVAPTVPVTHFQLFRPLSAHPTLPCFTLVVC